jgi:hypothetical protein
VTITSSTDCGAIDDDPGLVFLGPKAYIGSSGGGNSVPYTVAGSGFTATYSIPSTYTESGDSAEPVAAPVTPGSGYEFSTYPAGACQASFTVTG